MSDARQGAPPPIESTSRGPQARSDRAAVAELAVGVALNDALLTADPLRRRDLLQSVSGVGLDHVSVGDHIDFHDGTGFDGLIAATAVLASHDRLRVLIGVYLAALRHPLATARALSTLSSIAPGRVVLGVGVGGEDRREIANMGVDPVTRGRRLDETLQVLRAVASGGSVDHHGRFFDITASRICPPPLPEVPIVIGGAGEAAVRRVVSYGDGWLAMWCTARRFGATWQQVNDAAAASGKPMPTFAGLSIWCGFGPDEASGRELLERHLGGLYRLPHGKVRHLTPAGNAEDIAAFLQPYVDAGAHSITLVPVARDADAAIEGVGDVRRLLHPARTAPAPIGMI